MLYAQMILLIPVLNFTVLLGFKTGASKPSAFYAPRVSIRTYYAPPDHIDLLLVCRAGGLGSLRDSGLSGADRSRQRHAR